MASNPVQLLNEIYKSCDMGISAINALEDISIDKDLNIELQAEKSRYTSFADNAKTLLNILGEKPVEQSFLSKTAANVGITAQTLLNKGSSHIADLMIKGTTMGIIDLTKAYDGFGNQDQAVSELYNDVLQYEEQCVESLKTYL